MSFSCDPDVFLMNVGFNMRKKRLENKITQAQMAKNLNMAGISYGLIERGKAGTTLKTLVKIAEVLNVSPAKLLLNEDEILLTKADIAKVYAEEA